jgi:hypothetical protein
MKIIFLYYSHYFYNSILTYKEIVTLENFRQQLEQPSYLYGTMHAFVDATLDNNGKTFNETAQLYLEIDISSAF